MTLLGIPLAKIIVLIIISNMILGIAVLLAYEIQGWQDWAGAGMSVREVVREWRTGCVNTTYPGLSFWRCGHCSWAATKAMYRSALRGRF